MPQFRRVHYILFIGAFVPLLALLVYLNWDIMHFVEGVEPFLILVLRGAVPGAVSGTAGSLIIMWWKNPVHFSKLARLKYVGYWLVTGSLLGGVLVIIGWAVCVLLYPVIPVLLGGCFSYVFLCTLFRRYPALLPHRCIWAGVVD